MRIHTSLTEVEVYAALGEAWRGGPADTRDIGIDIMRHGSRSRAHAFEVSLSGYGDRHTRRKNSGQRGAEDNAYAATWSDWGRFLAALYERDPAAKCWAYDGAKAFHEKTCGLFVHGALVAPDTLADEVRELKRRAPNCSIARMRETVAERYGLPAYIVNSATYGETAR